MQNPFESGHIKNYILLYAAIVIIMILFFVATTLFHDAKNVKVKSWNQSIKVNRLEEPSINNQSQTNRFKLLEVDSKSYGKYIKGSEVNRLKESK